MSKQSTSAPVDYAGIRWNEQPNDSPAKSGVYQTRNDRNETWFKYFDANYSLWYMSWAELKNNMTRDTARISHSDLPRHVVAWAPCSKNGVKAHAVERIRRRSSAA